MGRERRAWYLLGVWGWEGNDALVAEFEWIASRILAQSQISVHLKEWHFVKQLLRYSMQMSNALDSLKDMNTR